MAISDREQGVEILENPQIYPKVNINQANKEELVHIPYIGEYTAQQIIRYREENNGFQSIEEIKKIKGIKERNYQRFVNYLSLNNHVF